jgi:galacturan 1,4-alpha-galacturonidase
MNPLKLTALISLAFGFTLAASLSRRTTCTVTSAGSASKDDVPAIEAAIRSCGNGGIIVLSSGVTYQLRSTLNLTGCTGCEIQIEGTLKMSDDLDFWQGLRAAILIDGIKGATITTKTGHGIVDGNGVPFWVSKYFFPEQMAC